MKIYYFCNTIIYKNTKMKKFTTFFIAILFITGSVFAQKTNDGGGSKVNNGDTKPKDNTNGGDKSGDNTLLKITKVLFGAYQANLMAASYKKPWITSFELMAHGGIYGSSINAVPRARLNYGALSADVRYDYISNDAEVSQNVDVLAEFNIIAGNFKMALGQGLMYSVDVEKSFHESFVGIDFGIMNRQIIISPEFRYVYDWNNKIAINSEFALKGGYRVLNLPKMTIYFNASAGYRSFLGSGNTILNGGLNFIFQ